MLLSPSFKGLQKKISRFATPAAPYRSLPGRETLWRLFRDSTRRAGVANLEILSRKGFCRNPRGIYPNKFPGEFCGGFFGVFFGPLINDAWKKQEEKSSQKSTAKFKSEFVSFAAKSTLQGSVLEILFRFRFRNGKGKLHRFSCAFAFVMIMSGTHKPQHLWNQLKSQSFFLFVFAFLIQQTAVPKSWDFYSFFFARNCFCEDTFLSGFVEINSTKIDFRPVQSWGAMVFVWVFIGFDIAIASDTVSICFPAPSKLQEKGCVCICYQKPARTTFLIWKEEGWFEEIFSVGTIAPENITELISESIFWLA